MSESDSDSESEATPETEYSKSSQDSDLDVSFLLFNEVSQTHWTGSTSGRVLTTAFWEDGGEKFEISLRYHSSEEARRVLRQTVELREAEGFLDEDVMEEETKEEEEEEEEEEEDEDEKN